MFAKFFFWRSGDKLQRSIEGLYRGILLEVLKRFPKLIPQVFPNFSASFHSPQNEMHLPEFRFEEAKVAFMNLITLPATSDHRICLFIDGLDEYEGDSLDYWSIARDLESWVVSRNVKICVTSRPYTEFMESFNVLPGQQIRLHQLTESDIRGFCLAMMEKDRNFDRIKESYHHLSETIVHRANGVFLWARLATRTFLAGVGYRDSPQMLYNKLKAIPDDMKTLFDKMLERVDSVSREDADKLLLIAAELSAFHMNFPAILYLWLDDLHDVTFPYNAQALRYSESDLADRVEVVRSRLDSLSKGMLELNTEKYGNYTVRFFHRTARDYLCESRVTQLKNVDPNFDVNESCCRLLFACLVFWDMEYAQGRNFILYHVMTVLITLFRSLSHSPNLHSEKPKMISLMQVLNTQDTTESRELGQLITRHTQKQPRWRPQSMVDETPCSKINYGRFSFQLPWNNEETRENYRIYSVQTRRETFEGGLVVYIGTTVDISTSEVPGPLNVFI